MAVGKSTVCNYSFTATGTAQNVVADVDITVLAGLGVGGLGVINNMSLTPDVTTTVIYLNIQDSAALPEGQFFAKDSVNSGNNTGWTFI